MSRVLLGSITKYFVPCQTPHNIVSTRACHFIRTDPTVLRQTAARDGLVCVDCDDHGRPLSGNENKLTPTAALWR